MASILRWSNDSRGKFDREFISINSAYSDANDGGTGYCSLANYDISLSMIADAVT